MRFHQLSYLIFLIFFFSIAECKSYSQHFPEIDQELPSCRKAEVAPRIALVLGGGGTRGIAHIGVLKELEDADIAIDLITGCSSGAMVAVFYAHSPSADLIKKELAELNISNMTDYSFFLGYNGLCSGEKLKTLFLKHIGKLHFEDLSIPTTIVTTDLHRGTLVNINSGPVAPAAHASAAYPFLFDPVKMYGSSYIDGGVLDIIPVQAAKDQGAECIIAVDLSPDLPASLPTNPFGVFKRCYEIQSEHQRNRCLAGADLVIDFDFNHVGTFDGSHTEEIYTMAREKTRTLIPKIRKLIEEKCHQ